MPFLFSYVCDLLQRLDDNRNARSGLRSNATIIQAWIREHHGLLYRDDHSSAPLLSALLPEKRTDRVYFIREKKLQIVIGRALGLGRSRIAELARWNNPEARHDLADCVESILTQTVRCCPCFPVRIPRG
jgi:DNA ligase-4